MDNPKGKLIAIHEMTKHGNRVNAIDEMNKSLRNKSCPECGNRPKMKKVKGQWCVILDHKYDCQYRYLNEQT